MRPLLIVVNSGGEAQPWPVNGLGHWIAAYLCLESYLQGWRAGVCGRDAGLFPPVLTLWWCLVLCSLILCWEPLRGPGSALPRGDVFVYNR